MTFTEWYGHTQNDTWHPDYAHLYMFAFEMAESYEAWCKLSGQEPVWDG